MSNICRLAGAFPIVEKIYHDFILERLEREFKDIPRPEFRLCRAYNTLLDWFKKNDPEISKLIKHGMGSSEQWDREIRSRVNEIITDAVLATLTKLGYLT